MPRVRYLANVDATEGTSILRLKKGADNNARLLVMGGAPLEITDQEFARLRGRYELQVLGAAQPEVVVDVSHVAEVPPAPPEAPQQPVVPADPLQSTTSSTPGGSSDEHPDTP